MHMYVPHLHIELNIYTFLRRAVGYAWKVVALLWVSIDIKMMLAPSAFHLSLPFQHFDHARPYHSS